MPVSGGGRQVRKLEFIEVLWKPAGAELTTVGPTVYPAFQVYAGDRVLFMDTQVLTGFDGTSVGFDVGDGTDPNGFIATAGVTEATPGIYEGAGAYLTTAPEGKLYTADGTVDISHTGASDATAGEALFVAALIREFPN